MKKYSKDELVVEVLPYAYGQKRIQVQTKDKVIMMFGEMHQAILAEI
jgi:hypothetical protein